MARNGSGGYSLPYPTFTPGTLADADKVTANNADLTTAVAGSLAANGEKTATGAQDWGGYRQTNVGAATARTDAPNIGQVQDSTATWCGTAGGTNNAITLSPSPAITAYVTGQRFRFKAGSGASDDAVTVAISGIAGTKAIERNDAALSASSVIAANKYYEILYDGTAFQLSQISAPEAQAKNALLSNIAAITPAAGDILYVDGSSDIVNLAKGTDGQVLKLASGLPSWAAAAAGGKLVAVSQTSTGAVATGTTAIPYDDSIPQITEGTEFMTLAHTAASATNAVIVIVEAVLSVNQSNADVTMALFKDSDAGGLAAIGGHIATSAGVPVTLTMVYREVPGDTSAHTYRMRAGNNGGDTTTFNGSGGGRKYGGVCQSSIIIMEYEV
jgi:hypothetical protein